MPTIEGMAKFDKYKPLIIAEYATANMEELAKKCECSVRTLQQRARYVGAKRDKGAAKQSRINALKKSTTHNRRERFVRGPGNQKIYELMDMKTHLIAAGFEMLACLNDRIIQSIKGGAAYDNFLTIHDGWGL